MSCIETFYFTFGVGHKLGGHCQPIQAKNHQEARQKMFEMHGKEWAFQYTEKQWEKATEEGFANEKLLPVVKA